jgi:hypothetical protein
MGIEPSNDGSTKNIIFGKVPLTFGPLVAVLGEHDPVELVIHIIYLAGAGNLVQDKPFAMVVVIAESIRKIPQKLSGGEAF